MPIFNLKCCSDECGKHFEFLGKIEEIQDLRCPKCGSDEIARQMSAHASYSIRGDNSASVTPKQFRGGK